MLKFEDYNNFNNDEEEVYRLTEWGCLWIAFNDYGIELPETTFKIKEAIMKDFMERMCDNGYIERIEE